MSMIQLETNRLILRTLNKTYLNQLFDFLVRNKDFLKPWSPEYEDGYLTIEHHMKRLESLEKDSAEGKAVKFCIFIKNGFQDSDTGKIIGIVSFSNIIKGPFLSCFTGYRIDENENRKGYATEALGEGIKYIYKEIGLHRIEANIMPRNTASIKVAEKLGFVFEGESKKYLKINGKWEDHLHYVLLNKEIE